MKTSNKSNHCDRRPSLSLSYLRRTGQALQSHFRRWIGVSSLGAMLCTGHLASAAILSPDFDAGTIGLGGGEWYNLGTSISSTSRLDAYQLNGQPYAALKDRGEFIFKINTTVEGRFFYIPNRILYSPEDLYFINSGEYDAATKTTPHMFATALTLSEGRGAGRLLPRVQPGTYYVAMDSSTKSINDSVQLVDNTTPPTPFYLGFRPVKNVVPFSLTFDDSTTRWSIPGSATGEVGNRNAARHYIPFYVNMSDIYSLSTKSRDFIPSKYIWQGVPSGDDSDLNLLMSNGQSENDFELYASLEPGVQYYAVISTAYDWDSPAVGNYEGFFDSVNGQVTIGLIPEPGTVSLLIASAGAGLVFALRRRRKV